MARGRRRSGPLGLSLIAGVLLACGSDGGVTANDGGSAASSPAPDTAAPALPECGAGEQPLVTAFERETGGIRWVTCTAETGHRWLAGATDELVYVTVTPESPTDGSPATGSAELVALDTATGAERWRADLGSPHVRIPNGPFPGGSGVAVVVTMGGAAVNATILGLDATTGAEMWSTPGPNVGYAADGDVVVAARGPAAYDRATGAPRWTASVTDTDLLYADPVIADDLVVVGTNRGAVAFALDSGAERWRSTQVRGVPAGAGDGVLVYSGQDDPTTGLDLDTGEVLWTRPGHSTYDDVAAIGNGAFYALETGDGAVGGATAYELRTGEVRWQNREVAWPFAADDTSVLIVDPDLAVLSGDDGTLVWRTPASTTYRIVSAAMNGDTVFAAGEDTTFPVPPTGGVEQTVATRPAVDSARCAGGVEIGGFDSSTLAATVVVAADRSAFCVVPTYGTEDVVEVQRVRQVSAPEASVVIGELAVYVDLTVPIDWSGTPLEILDEVGQPVLALPMPDSADILLVVLDAPLDSPPETFTPRSFSITRGGQELGTVSVELPPTGTADQMVAAAIECLRVNGVRVAAGGMPNAPADLDRQPLDPAVTTAAWAACGAGAGEFVRASGMPDPEREVLRLECLAGRGFIAMFLGGEYDAAAFAAADADCRAVTSGTPQPTG